MHYQDAPMATVPPMRVCSPALDSSNSGRTNSTLPAAMRTPANPLSVPAVDSLRTISRLVHVKTLLVSVQPAGDSRVDFTRVTPRPPPAYGCVRPLPKYLRMRARAAVTVESKRTPLSKLRFGLLGLGQRFDAPAVRRLEPYTAADGHPEAEVTLVVPELDALRSWRRLQWIGQTRKREKNEGDE